MTVTIRAANRADAPRLAALHIESRRAAMPWLPVLHTIDETAGYIADELMAHCAVVVAEEDGRVLGYVAVDAARGELEHLYLAPDAQRRGLGSRLLEDAKARSPGGLALWVFQGNAAARAFYAARGFTLEYLTDGAGNEERTPDARYGWPGFHEPAGVP